MALLREVAMQGTRAWNVLDHIVAADDGAGQAAIRPIPDPLWKYLIDLVSPEDAFDIAFSADARGALDSEIYAFLKSSESELDDVRSRALFNLGVLMYMQGDLNSAETYYRRTYKLHRGEPSNKAATNLASILQDRESFAEAEQLLRRVIKEGRAEEMARAAHNLGNMLDGLGDAEGAEEAYRVAIESGISEYIGDASVNLGVIYKKKGRFEEAVDAYRTAMASSSKKAAAIAAVNLGNLLREQGNLQEAASAYHAALEVDHPDEHPKAAMLLGDLQSETGDLEGAQQSYRIAISSGQSTVRSRAAFALGQLLYDIPGELTNARNAYEIGMEAADSEIAAAAGFRLASLLEEHEYIDEALAIYRIVAESRDPIFSASSAANVGRLMALGGDPVGALDAFELSLQLGDIHSVLATIAKLGDTLVIEGNIDAAKRAYQLAMGSRDTEWSLHATIGLGIILAQERDAEGAYELLTRVTNSGHQELAALANQVIEELFELP
ncbi:tetratricopeptide repeat protein [Streptosporangiaceae bacterium NEAU-GS5]|nr:tetratricopeptide repeat protein [Streptosporangiaceae bacterium NEAU-GS5]